MTGIKKLNFLEILRIRRKYSSDPNYFEPFFNIFREYSLTPQTFNLIASSYIAKYAFPKDFSLLVESIFVLLISDELIESGKTKNEVLKIVEGSIVPRLVNLKKYYKTQQKIYLEIVIDAMLDESDRISKFQEYLDIAAKSNGIFFILSIVANKYNLDKAYSEVFQDLLSLDHTVRISTDLIPFKILKDIKSKNNVLFKYSKFNKSNIFVSYMRLKSLQNSILIAAEKKLLHDGNEESKDLFNSYLRFILGSVAVTEHFYLFI